VEVTTDLPLRLGAPIWSSPQQIQAGSEVIEGYTGMAQAIVPVLEIGDANRKTASRGFSCATSPAPTPSAACPSSAST
jgi:hypothetical protein